MVHAMQRSMATTSQLYVESRSIGIEGSPTYMLSYLYRSEFSHHR
jgi:hypothetical protein